MNLIGIKTMMVCIAVIVVVMPVLSYAASDMGIGITVPTPTIVIQDNLESKLRINITKFNSTAWNISADLEPAFKAAALDCFTNLTDTNPQTQCSIPEFKSNWLAGTGISVGNLLSDMQQINNMPITSVGKTKASKNNVNYFTGFDFIAEFPDSNVLKIGQHTAIISPFFANTSFGIMRQSNGTLWTFFKNSTGSVPAQLAKSSNNGSSWTTNIMKLPPSNNAEGFISAVIDSNDTIHMYYATDVGTAYFRYTIVNNSWYNTTIETGGSGVYNSTAIVAKRNGTLVIMAVSNGNQILYHESGNNGSTWSPTRTISTISLSTNKVFSAVENYDGAIYYTYNANPSQMGYGNISKAGVFGAATNIIIDTAQSGIWAGLSMAVDKSDNIYIAAGFFDTDGRIYTASILNSTKAYSSGIMASGGSLAFPAEAIDIETGTNIIAYQKEDRCFITNFTITIELAVSCRKPVFNDGSQFPAFNTINSSVNGSMTDRIEMVYVNNNNNLSFLYIDPRSLLEMPFQVGVTTFTINVYDEDSNMARRVNSSVIISNSTISQSFSVNGSRSFNFTEIPTGDVQVAVFFNAGTLVRNYYFTIDPSKPSQTLNAFVPNITAAANTPLYFTFMVTHGNSILPGSMINFSKFINSSLRLIAQGRTQGDGIATILLEPFSSMTVTVENPGYVTNIFPYQLSSVLSSQVITFALNASNVSAMPATNTWIDPTLSLIWQPANTTYLTGRTDVNVSLIDTSGTLSWFALRVNYYNLTSNVSTFAFVNLTGAQFFTQNVTVNKIGYFTFIVTVAHNGSVYSTRRVYVVQNVTGLRTVPSTEEAGGLSSTFFQLIVLTLIGAGMAAAYKAMGAQGAIFVMIIGIAAATYYQIFPIGIGGLMILFALMAFKAAI